MATCSSTKAEDNCRHCTNLDKAYQCLPLPELAEVDAWVTRCQNNSETPCDSIEARDCSNTDNGATDRDGKGCSYYTSSPSVCTYADTSTFKANTMCCACGGGYNNSETLVSGCNLTEVKTAGNEPQGVIVVNAAGNGRQECWRTKGNEHGTGYPAVCYAAFGSTGIFDVGLLILLLVSTPRLYTCCPDFSHPALRVPRSAAFTDCIHNGLLSRCIARLSRGCVFEALLLWV